MPLHRKGAFEILLDLGLLAEGQPKTLGCRDSPDLFNCIHLAGSNAKLTSLFRLFAPDCYLSPRSGNIGNWNEIIAGRAGSLDFNAAICRSNRFGYAALYDLTNTETADGAYGDTIYLPGSAVERGLRKYLQLYSWNGDEWVAQSRAESLYVPFVQVPGPDGLIALTRFQRSLTAQRSDFSLSYYSDLLELYRARLIDLLVQTCEACPTVEDRRSFLEMALYNCVRPDGHVEPLRLRLLPNDRYDVNGHIYNSMIDLARAALAAATTASQHCDLPAFLPTLPPAMPLISGRLHTLLFALLETHYPHTSMSLNDPSDELIVHIHWAENQIAGFPSEPDDFIFMNAMHYRYLYGCIIRQMPRPRPIYYIIAPATIFSLCPSSAICADIELTNELFAAVTKMRSNPGPDQNQIQSGVMSAVRTWWFLNERELSPYFKSSFGSGKGIAGDATPPDGGRPIMLDTFFDLTFMEASAIVRALDHMVAGSQVPVRAIAG